MQNNNTTTETLIGLLVVAVLAGVIFFAYTTSGRGSVSGYDVKASFTSADGIAPGTEVRLNGIKIGSVSTMELDPKTYQAILHFTIRDDVELPVDSSVKVTSTGLLGSPYLAITPGGEDMGAGRLVGLELSCDAENVLGPLWDGEALEWS